MKQYGDFRSEECIELLQEADIVVTNPPFSLFREYVAQLVKYNKKFIIIGNPNAIICKEIFLLIKNNKIWLGHGFKNGNAFFKVPSDNIAIYSKSIYNENTSLVKFRNCNWFTNLDHPKLHENLDLVSRYNPEYYPKYDNYDAINVDKTLDIPEDYYGIMGVPISFLDKYCPEQFAIVGCTAVYGIPKGWNKNTNMNPIVNGKCKYKRLLIRKIKENSSIPEFTVCN